MSALRDSPEAARQFASARMYIHVFAHRRGIGMHGESTRCESGRHAPLPPLLFCSPCMLQLPAAFLDGSSSVFAQHGRIMHSAGGGEGGCWGGLEVVRLPVQPPPSAHGSHALDCSTWLLKNIPLAPPRAFSGCTDTPFAARDGAPRMRRARVSRIVAVSSTREDGNTEDAESPQQRLRERQRHARRLPLRLPRRPPRTA